jgi:hypothetical protein
MVDIIKCAYELVNYAIDARLLRVAEPASKEQCKIIKPKSKVLI